MSDYFERMTPLEMVREFHQAMEIPIRVRPAWGWIGSDEEALRNRLLAEEYQEYLDAVSCGTLVDLADALADMVYIIYGTALTYGIDLDSVLEEVHRSNMTKLGPEGPIRRHDGKVLKPDGFEPPDLKRILDDKDVIN